MAAEDERVITTSSIQQEPTQVQTGGSQTQTVVLNTTTKTVNLNPHKKQGNPKTLHFFNLEVITGLNPGKRIGTQSVTSIPVVQSQTLKSSQMKSSPPKELFDIEPEKVKMLKSEPMSTVGKNLLRNVSEDNKQKVVLFSSESSAQMITPENQSNEKKDQDERTEKSEKFSLKRETSILPEAFSCIPQDQLTNQIIDKESLEYQEKENLKANFSGERID